MVSNATFEVWAGVKMEKIICYILFALLHHQHDLAMTPIICV